jgi:hypothetical protein
MDWQQLTSLLIVAAAAWLLVRSKIRRGRFRAGQSAPCGCGIPQTAPRQTMVFRARKGSRPEVVIRMG